MNADGTLQQKPMDGAQALHPPHIRIEGVSKRFGDFTAVRDIDLTIGRGELFALLGGSGCGKSAVMRQAVGLLPPSEGHVEVLGFDMYAGAPDARLAVLRRIGVMFQSGALFGSMTLLENVMLPLEMNTDLPPDGRREVARLKLGLVGLADAADLLPSEISGGPSAMSGVVWEKVFGL